MVRFKQQLELQLETHLKVITPISLTRYDYCNSQSALNDVDNEFNYSILGTILVF